MNWGKAQQVRTGNRTMAILSGTCPWFTLLVTLTPVVIVIVV